MSNDQLSRWEDNWGRCPLIAHELRSAYPDQWVRFHSLPESKRYPDSAKEWAIVLDRYNTVLGELFDGQDVHVITPDWNDQPEPDPRPVDHERWHPRARHLTSICLDDDPEFQSYWHLYVSHIPWRSGGIDLLLRAVANDQTAGVMITDLAVRRIYHPYDGGADVLLTSREERDHLRRRHVNWLSKHPLGL